MANRYWVGSVTTWNNVLSWSATSGGAPGASVPGSSDAAILDASSGSVTVTLDISPNIQTLTCTGFTGTLAFGTNTISLNSTSGIFTGATTMTVTGTPLIICTNSSASSRTINPGVVTEANSISFRVTAGTGNFVLTSGNSRVRDLDFTDGINPTGFSGTLTSTFFDLYGSLKASTGMAVSAGTGALLFLATSGVKTITTAGVTFDRPFTFDGVGGTWQLQDAMTLGSTRATTLTSGTLNLSSYTLTTGLFSSSNANVRTIAFGTGKLVLSGSTTTIWNTDTATNFTYTGTGRVELMYSGATGTRSIFHGIAGGTEANSPNFYITAGTDTVNFAGTGRKFGTIDFTGFGAGTGNVGGNQTIYGNLVLVSAMTLSAQTSPVIFGATSGTKTITTAGKTMDIPVTFDGVGGTWQLQDAMTVGSTRTTTLTNGSLSLAGYTLTTGIFSSSSSNIRNITFSGGTVTITGTNWTTTTTTNLTTDATGTISMNSASPKTFAGGSSTWGKLQNSGAGALTITGANTFMELNNSVSPAFFVFPASTTTSAYSFTLNGTASNLVSLRSSAPGTAYTLVKL